MIDKNPAAAIQHLANEKLEVFLNSIRVDGTYKDPIYKSAQRIGQQITNDYGSRFLIELVQNAYDAHTRDTNNGKILIFLAQEEDHGVLYVADRGHGFTWNDVEALCNIGISNKPVGQSIGNKGLGFRSVYYVSDDPQVYSNFPGRKSAAFNGYCFRFAHDVDFDTLIQNSDRRRLAKEDIPQFHIPIPIARFPANALRLTEQGFTTIIRLPLRNGAAYQAVIKQIESIRDSVAPLLLFLARLVTLDIVVQEKPELSCCLTRSSKDLQRDRTPGFKDSFTIVILNKTRFFVSWHTVPENIVKQAIGQSIQQGQLHQAWTDWTGDGEVAVAVPLDDRTASPKLYTFLPMGEQAESPFHGHLHGSFYPRADRTSLDPEIPVNGLYIDEAMKLCARTILALRNESETDSALSSNEKRRVMMDLLAWKQSWSIERTGKPAAPILMRRAFSELGTDFLQADIFPVVLRKWGDWGRASELIRWDQPDLSLFGASSLAIRQNMAILDPHLGEDRLNRIQVFIEKGDERLSLKPCDLQLAEIAERFAAEIFQRKPDIEALKEYYLELTEVFRNRAKWLSNRRILYCSDGLLRAAMPADSGIPSEFRYSAEPAAAGMKTRRRSPDIIIAVFSPSRPSTRLKANSEEQNQVLSVPEELSESFAFLTDKVDWYGELEPVRDFLETNKLVRRYDANDVVSQVSILVRRTKRKRTLEAVLTWLFKLWRTSWESNKPVSLQNARLFIPAISGKWIEAEKAVFSAGWPSRTSGDIMEKFLSQTGACAHDLKQLHERLLCHPDDKDYFAGYLDDWADFLEAIGVNRGLQPLKISANLTLHAWELEDRRICSRFKLGDDTVRYWKTDVDEHGESPSHPGNQYDLEGDLWYFPGQDRYGAFPDDAKLLFARLVLDWMPSADDGKFDIPIFSRSARWASRFHWPTPLGAFLRQAPWFPVEVPDGLAINTKFFKPSELWLSGEKEGDRVPPYLPQPHRAIRPLPGTESSAKLVAWCKANVLNDTGSLIKQLNYLAALFAQKEIDPYYLQSFISLYYGTWDRLAVQDVNAEKIADQRIQYLVVRKNGRPVSLPLGRTSEAAKEREAKIFVRDTPDETLADIVSKLGFYVFDPGTQNASKVIALLKELLGSRFQTVSDFKFDLLIDGNKYDLYNPAADFAVNQCPWIPFIVYIATESLTGTAAHRLPDDQTEIISRVSKIRLHLAGRIQFDIGSQVFDLPDNAYGCISFKNGVNPLIIVQSNDTVLHWSTLARSSSHIAQVLDRIDLGASILAGFRTLERINESVAGPVPTSSKWIGELCAELRIDRGLAEKAIEGLLQVIKQMNQ